MPGLKEVHVESLPHVQVLGVHQTEPTADSDYRFKFGFVETTGHSVSLKVTAFDDNGRNLGSATMQVREFSQRQLAFKDYFPTVSTESVRLQAVAHLGLPTEARARVEIKVCETSHMMYVHEPALRQFKADVAAFVAATDRL